ncbi:MAG: hypothetical protein ACRD3S_03350 [Terracidiphilus sp.]
MLKLYRGAQGRKSLTDAVLANCPDYIAREFRLHADLIGLWRDQSAHAPRRDGSVRQYARAH